MPDVDLVARRLATTATRFGDLLRHAGGLDGTVVGTWSGADVAAHVVWELEVYTAMLEGDGRRAATLDGIAELNEQGLAEVTDRDGPGLADRLAAALPGYLTAAEALADDPLVRWHGGLELPASTVIGLHLGELLVHGYDVAQAAGRTWPIPGEDAALVFRALRPVLPHYLDEGAARGFRGRFDVRLRGEPEARTLLAVADGALAVGNPDGGRVDCVISADPATFLLVNYGRKGPVGPALTGKVVAWGRRPWLALGLPKTFRAP